jgi:hypothetical protein
MVREPSNRAFSFGVCPLRQTGPDHSRLACLRFSFQGPMRLETRAGEPSGSPLVGQPNCCAGLTGDPLAVRFPFPTRWPRWPWEADSTRRLGAVKQFCFSYLKLCAGREKPAFSGAGDRFFSVAGVPKPDHRGRRRGLRPPRNRGGPGPDRRARPPQPRNTGEFPSGGLRGPGREPRP